MVGKGKAVIALPTDLRQMVATRLPCPVGYRLRYDFQKRRLTHLGP